MSLRPRASDHPRRLLCVFAHPDDEVFCAGSLLARWVAAGSEAMVVSATRGEAGQIRDASAATRRTLGAVREQELHAACAAVGVRRVRCLDHRDGTLHRVNGETLAAEVAALIRDFDPDVVVTFGPDGGYGHPDHVATSAATTRACELTGVARGRMPDLYYSAFPQQHHRLSLELARWLITEGAGFRGTAGFIQALALLADEATLLRYVSDTVQTQWYPAGFAILEQGEPAGCLYLIVSGRVDIVQADAFGRARACRTLGPGQFFGAEALAHDASQAASAIARGTVTCLLISPQPAAASAGRGAGILADTDRLAAADDDRAGQIRYIACESSRYFERKVAALAAHRTQFAFDPAPFPTAVLRMLLGAEYFERAAVPVAAAPAAARTRGVYLRAVGQPEGMPA